MLSVCLHEIGHTLGLDDHGFADGIDCAMVGDVPSHRQFDPASYPTQLCTACRAQALERMAAFGAELDANAFNPVAGALVMDWIAGRDLESLRQERSTGVFDAAHLRAWAGQLCAAVQAAHDRGITHLDIKPENCLIDSQGALHLADFGFARSSDHPRGTFLCGATLPAGTPGFVAPEEMRGAPPWPAQDISSIGATLCWLLTGQHARVPGDNGFPACEVTVPTVNHARRAMGAPPVPEVWETAIAACLEWNSVRRPASAAEVARRLSTPPIKPINHAGESPHPESQGTRGLVVSAPPVPPPAAAPPVSPPPAPRPADTWWTRIRRFLEGASSRDRPAGSE